MLLYIFLFIYNFYVRNLRSLAGVFSGFWNFCECKHPRRDLFERCGVHSDARFAARTKKTITKSKTPNGFRSTRSSSCTKQNEKLPLADVRGAPRPRSRLLSDGPRIETLVWSLRPIAVRAAAPMSTYIIIIHTHLHHQSLG